MRSKLFSLPAIIIILLLFSTTNCKKDPIVPEENLRISTDAPIVIENPGPDFNFNLRVESAMPNAGVKIVYTVKGEIDNQAYPQGPAIETTGNATPITIRNLPRQKFCICTITVSSKNAITNTATTSFRIIYK